MTLGCLILSQRYKRRLEDYLLVPENGKFISNLKYTQDSEHLSQFSAEERECNEQRRMSAETQTPSPNETDIEDLFKPKSTIPRPREYCNSEFNCNGKSRENCQRLMKVYQSQTISHIKEFTENMKSMRHTVFLILLLCSMFVVGQSSI